MRQKPADRRPPTGFTLIEMLVATVLASVVLLGLFNLVTSMVTNEVNSMRTGTVSAWSLTAAKAMTTDISGASTLRYPAAGGAGSDYLIVCSNFSPMMNTAGGGTMNGGTPKSAQYCYDTTEGAPYGNSILRLTTNSCPAAPVTPCTSANYGGGSIVVTGVYRDSSNHAVFYTEPNAQIPNAVRIRYSIGNPAANAASAGSNGGTVTGAPVSIPYNTEVILED
jgi:prepilin-type N-terminal cleavage/methylation domain-containing protein